MSLSPPIEQPHAPSRIAGWALALAAVSAAGLLAWVLLASPDTSPGVVPVAQPPVAPMAPAPLPVAAQPAARVVPPPARIGVTAPSFDVVRVDPRGEAVLAGRGSPGARIVVRDNGRDIAQAQADRQGQWVTLPATPLTPGGHQLTVATVPDHAPARVAAAADPSGRNAPPSSAQVIIVLPAPDKPAPSGPLALLVPDSGPPRLLQAPTPPVAAGAPPGGVTSQPAAMALPAGGPLSRLGLGIVDYDGQGALRFAGTAPPGSTVRAYIDRRPAGDARADALGRWTLQPTAALGAGEHQLRLDQLADSGAVSARVALPFERVLLPDGAVPAGRMVVQPGQSLWRIARAVYGRGIRYTVIYLANRGQIRNPALIYPGQVFAVPAAGPAPDPAAPPKPNPVASSATR